MQIKWTNWNGVKVNLDERPSMVERAVESAKACGGIGYCMDGDTLVLVSITTDGTEVYDCYLRRTGEPIKGD